MATDSNGRKIDVLIDKKGNITLGKNSSADLQGMAGLINQSGSKTARQMFQKLGQNDTKITFKIETKAVDNHLSGVHQAHDQNGNALSWKPGSGGTGKFEGNPAYIKDKNGNAAYKEASITVFEGNFSQQHIVRQRQAADDPNLSKENMMVSTFTHEGFHDTDQQSIDAIKTRQEGGVNNFDVEKAAYEGVSDKVYEEVRKD